MWDLWCFDDSCTLRNKISEIGYDDVCYIGFEVFEERGSEGGTIDFCIVDADIVGVLICCRETLLHEG